MGSEMCIRDSAPGDRVASERGCAVLVRVGLSARTVGRVTVSWISVRVDGEARGPATNFTSIYLPIGRQGQPYRDALGHHLFSLRASYPGDTLIVGGDWNLDEAGLLALLSQWALGLPSLGPFGLRTLRPALAALALVVANALSIISLLGKGAPRPRIQPG